MSKKSILPSLASLLEVLPKATPPKENSNPELDRIATALERIATALETLAAQEEPPSQDDEDYWITLPNVDPPSVPKQEPIKTALLIPQPSSSATLAPVSKKESVLRQYLTQRGITFQEAGAKLTPQQKAYQHQLDYLAHYLGQNFTVCESLYKLVRSNLKAPRSSFQYTLSGASMQENAVIREFCKLLKEADLLDYTYQGRPGYSLELKTTGKEQKYLTGSWLEKYVKLEVARIIQPYSDHNGRRYEALPNLEINKDATKTELDLFFALGKNKFCVEAKMRPSLADLNSYLTRIKPLALDEAAILVIVADKSQQECAELSQALGKVRVARLNSLEQALVDMIKTTPQ